MVTVEMLKRFPLLAHLPREDLAELMEVCEIETWEAGQIVGHEGDRADKLRLILLGKVALDKRIQLGHHGTVRRANVSIVGPGRAFCWSAVVAPHILTLTSVCLEPCKFIAIDSERLQTFMDENPQTARRLLSSITEVVGSRLKDATNMLTYFLSIVSHELRAPLAAVENYMQVMLGGFTGELTPKQERMLERSLVRIHDFSGLISNLLDLARMRPEEIQTGFVRFNPQEVGYRSVEDTSVAAKERGVEVKVIAPDEFREMVGAPERLRQVLTNLLSNAIKFSPEGSTVTLRTWETENDLWIEVSDEGIGIPPEDQDSIFADFFRASNVGDVTGSGLGLSIAKKIVDAHQGRIWLESPYEGLNGESMTGTRFTVVIPYVLSLPEKRENEETAPSIEE